MSKKQNIVSFSQWKENINSTESMKENGKEPLAKTPQSSKTFKELLTAFGNKTSLTSINFMKSPAPWIVKVIWILLTLTALGFNIAHIQLLVHYYTTWPKQTELSLSYNPLPLPDITICNTNPVRKCSLKQMPDYFKDEIDERDPEKRVTEKYGQRKKREAVYSNFSNTYERSSHVKKNSHMGERNDVTRNVREYEYLYSTVNRTLRQKAGHQMIDMLLDCSFRGWECNYKMFNVTQNKDYGNCYTISKKNYVVEKSGPSEGLTITLLLETFEYLPTTSGYGARVQIHEPGTAPLPTEHGFFVAANTETSIGIYLVNISRLGQPHGSCEEGDAFAEELGIKYDRQVCLMACQLKKLITTCGCYDFQYEELSIRINKTVRPCVTTKELECQLGFDFECRKNNHECTDCESPCRETDYVKSVSSRAWPTTSYMRFLINKICDRKTRESEVACNKLNHQYDASEFSNLSQNFLKMNIYYEDLNYQVVKETAAYQDIEFYSDMGGAIGLWIGLSVLSFCEAGQLVLEVLLLVCNKLFRRNI